MKMAPAQIALGIEVHPRIMAVNVGTLQAASCEHLPKLCVTTVGLSMKLAPAQGPLDDRTRVCSISAGFKHRPPPILDSMRVVESPRLET